VPARRDLGHDPAEARVQRCLRRDDVREELAVARDDRSRRLVTGGLEPEDHGLSARAERLSPVPGTISTAP